MLILFFNRTQFYSIAWPLKQKNDQLSYVEQFEFVKKLMNLPKEYQSNQQFKEMYKKFLQRKKILNLFSLKTTGISKLMKQ